LSYNAEENKTILISLLKANIQQKTSNIIKEMKDTHKLYIAISDEANDKIIVESKKKGNKKNQFQQENSENKNYFCAEWALKENQVYGKKGGGKRMTETIKEILKSFFHAGDKDKIQIGELEAEEIP
ncbi:7437_t:CDS:2, partial [Racocetra fulgida]